MKITYQKGMLNFEKTENKIKSENEDAKIKPKIIIEIIKHLTAQTKQGRITWAEINYSSFSEFSTKLNGVKVAIDVRYKDKSTSMSSCRLSEPFSMNGREINELGRTITNLFRTKSERYQKIKALKIFFEI